MLRVVELRLQRPNQLLLLLGQRAAAVSAPVWIDEAPDDAVERGAVEDAGLRQPQEVAHVLRRLVAERTRA